MAGTRSPGWPVLLMLLVLGGIIGGWIGQTLTNVWPSLVILGRAQSLGIPSFTLDLQVFTVSFGFMLHISAFTLIGFVLAYVVYRRM
ncbi:MAG: DUF4321 domain-containing protein [Syntrophomonadaceae bacterium]|jgi:hypothetical protein|nr:DUF4321 domain-containing protein [Bacillota bacterium]NLM89158.1 DUF4321 domain-containing protein [Syntrophomonadaceae bacterium]HAA08448.1 DUF4321 domain-containing protein [Syntrophomonas sp.]